MRSLLALVLMTACLGTAPSRPAQPTSPRFWLRVRPAIAMAPSDIEVTLRIAPDGENRSFSVSMSALCGAHRLSAETLDGARAPSLYSWFWRQMPAGDYVVRADLYGTSRRRATAYQSVLLR